MYSENEDNTRARANFITELAKSRKIRRLIKLEDDGAKLEILNFTPFAIKPRRLCFSLARALAFTTLTLFLFYAL